MDRMENKKTELVYFKIKQKLANLIGIIKGIQVKRLVVKRKAVNFSEHYGSLSIELLSQVLRQLRALHSMNRALF